MKVIVTENYEEMSRIAAKELASVMLQKKDCVLGLATGSPPVGTYKRLIEDNKAGKIDFSTVTSVNLDEYVGLDGSNDQS
jgi:glucosamine-6-phosphate deaminase